MDPELGTLSYFGQNSKFEIVNFNSRRGLLYPVYQVVNKIFSIYIKNLANGWKKINANFAHVCILGSGLSLGAGV